MITVNLRVEEQAPISLQVEEGTVCSPLGVETVIVSSMVPDYQGTYTITPGDEVIVLNTSGMKMERDVTIDKIPSNYGKIGWNGSYLTVT